MLHVNKAYQAMLDKAREMAVEANEIRDKAVEENRVLTGEEALKLKGIYTESSELADNARDLIAIEEKANAPEYKHPAGDGDPDFKTSSPEGQLTSEEEMTEIMSKLAVAKDSYLRTGSHDEIRKFKADHEGKVEVKLLSRLTDPAGGYLCGTDESATIIRKRDIVDFIRPRCKQSKTTDPKKLIIALEDTLTISMIGEGGTYPEYTGMVAGAMYLTPHKGGGFVKITDEQLEDSKINMVGLITEMYGTAIGKKQLEQWIDGTGTKEPMGVLRSIPAALNHDIATGTSGTIIPEDIQDFTMLLESQYLTPGCAWVMSTATMIQIVSLRSNADGAQTGTFLWEPSFKAGIPNMLQGYPVIRVPDAYWPTISADGDPLLAFGDWLQYEICDRTGFRIKRMNEKYADEGKVGFRVESRWDGKLVDANAFIRLNRT